jgi:hypothetical protein
MEPHSYWTPNSLLFGTTKPATSNPGLKLPTYSQNGLGYFAFAPVEPSFNSEDASLSKQAEERRLRDEEERKKRDEELAQEWQLEEEGRLQRRAREAEEARRGEECWVRSGGILRDANGKRDMVRTQAIRDELKLREEEKLLMDRWERYEADWAKLLEQAKLGASRTIQFRDIPWPIDSMDKNTLTLQLLTADNVEEFLFGVLRVRGYGVTKKERVRSSLLRWHPDKMTVVVAKVAPEDVDVVLHGINSVTLILQGLNAKL